MKIQLCASQAPVACQPFEYVERKGLGHPDSICDSVMEAAAQSLRRDYMERCGRVLHHNLDKALLVAGQSQPLCGGGRVVSPLQVIAGDRATTEFDGQKIPIDEIVEAAVLEWMDANLRFVEPSRHVAFQSLLKPGSHELMGIFDRDTPVANDTSAAVGYAPLTKTEQLVLSTEQYMNSAAFKHQFPVAGEDVKVMAVRQERSLRITIAVAFVDRYIADGAAYFALKEAMRNDVLQHVRGQLGTGIEELSVAINTLDDPARGEAGMYLTVLGTSAESGDGGEVGRGNSVNGLISLSRPTSNEAAAGKNATCHVGNIYSHLTHRIAGKIVASIGPVREATVWLCSQIGQPVDQPWSTSVSVVLDPTVEAHDVEEPVEAIIREELRRTLSAD